MPHSPPIAEPDDALFYERMNRRATAGFCRPRFRGGAVSNLGGAPMGKGHGNAGRPFDPDTACYTKPVFAEYDAAIANGRRLFLVVKAGVKTIKSYMLEVCCADHVCNRLGDAAIFFGTQDAAETTATTRILDHFKGDNRGGGIPRFREKMKTLRNRFEDAMGAIKFPDKTLFILAANLGNCQQKNLAFAGLQDAFVTGATGMIKEMTARTTQYEREAIIFLESQGGEVGFDFDRAYDDTDQRELHVNCPDCGRRHIYNWKVYDPAHMTRPDDFVPTPPLIIPSLDHEAWIAHHRPLMLAKDRRIAGFKRGDEKLIKLESGEYDEKAILRETHFECFHCGGIWKDDGEFGKTRIALDQSSHYIAARTDALPTNIGFNIPQWINRRLGWGGMMLEKLKAQRLANELGNPNDLKIWYQKVAARTWNPANMMNRVSERPGANVYDLDPAKKFPGELVRISATDIQFKLTHMVYLAVAVGDGTPPWVLHFEWVKPPSGLTDHQAAEHCKGRVRELDKQFGIQQQNAMKDAAHEPGLVREWAAEDANWARPGQGKSPCWFAYGLLLGDDRPSYKWVHPGRKDSWERFKQYQWHKVPCIKNGKRAMVDVHHRLWSNPSIKEIASRWRDGEGAPKLQIHEKFLRDAGKEGFWSQMTSERLIPWKGHPGKLHYNNEGRPNHAWDCWCMIVERMDELGYLNSFGAPPEDEGD